jgi:hypothetical protein
MRTIVMTKIALACVVALALGLVVSAQKETKPWTEWTKKDAVKILNDSGWGQTQLETQEASGSASAVTSTAESLNRDPKQAAPGSINGSIKYFVRFLSARPIREAFVRKVQLEQPSADPQVAEQSKTFIEMASDQFIIVAVAAEVSDKKMGGGIMQAFNKAKVESLKNVIYLQRKDGKRVFLQEYVPPGNADIGARFVFPRKLDGQPYLTADSGEVRFHAELGSDKKSRIDCRFKIADMMYNGALEY